MKVTARYAVFAPHHNANAWLALGWMPHPAFERCYHGQFSVLCVWICDCEMRRVRKDPERSPLSQDMGCGASFWQKPLQQDEFQIEHQRDHDDNREGGRYGEGFW